MNTQLYECACGCTVPRSEIIAIKPSMKLHCKEHRLTGPLLRRIAQCDHCPNTFEVPKTSRGRVWVCPECKDRGDLRQRSNVFTNPQYYECACGCENDRSGIYRVRNNSAHKYCCSNHPNEGYVFNRYAYCTECGDEFDIKLSATSTPIKCQECKDTNNNYQNGIKMRKWDCSHYEDCLFKKPRVVSFDCDKCTEYAKQELKIDLSRTYDQNTDDLNITPRSNPGGKN